jgi:hypothetical protein
MPAWSSAAPEWLYRAERLRRPERMDDPRLDPAEHQAALEGLERISRWPGQREPLLRAVLGLLGPATSRRVRVIEVGAGSGHLAAWMRRRLGSLGYRAEVLASDRVAAPGVRRLDALSTRLPEADVYCSNLLLHHLPDDGVQRMLRAQSRASRRGWAHYDLHRHWLHFYGASFLLRAAGLPRINWSDGLRSIQQGFRREELLALAPAGAAVSWHAPFRWCLRWQRP